MRAVPSSGALALAVWDSQLQATCFKLIFPIALALTGENEEGMRVGAGRTLQFSVVNLRRKMFLATS